MYDVFHTQNNGFGVFVVSLCLTQIPSPSPTLPVSPPFFSLISTCVLIFNLSFQVRRLRLEDVKGTILGYLSPMSEIFMFSIWP